MRNQIRQQNYHVVVDEWWDEHGNFHREETQYRMTGAEAHIVTENRSLRHHNQAMKLINGKANDVRPQLLEDQQGPWGKR